MGAGRKTYSYETDTVGSYDLNFELKQRNLRQDLGGVIFMANNVTIRECQENLIFGLPSAHWCYVQHVRKGMPIFLYNFSNKTLHGIYTATDEGGWEINPHGWTADGAGKTRYPAQVQVQVHLDCPPLSERQFRSAIAENYHHERGQEKFKQELDKAQAAQLCGLFRRERERVWGAAGVSLAGGSGAGVVAQKRPASAAPNGGHGGGAAGGGNGAGASKTTRVGAGPGSRPSSQAAVAPVQSQQAPQAQRPASGAAVAAPAAATFASAAAAAPAPPAAASAGHKPGVEMLSDEITGLKTALGPLIMRLRASTVPGDDAAANALSASLGRLDDVLMVCQKERSKLMMALSNSKARAEPAAPAVPAAAAAPVAALPVKHTDVIFVGGLLDGKGYSLSCDVFSPGSEEWHAGPQLLHRRAYCGAAALGRHVFVVGGGSGPNTWHDTTLRLDLATGECIEVAPLAAARGSLGCVALGDKVYAIGGGRAGAYETSTEVYDSAKNVWTRGPALTTSRFTTAAAALDGAIYAVGGFDGKSYLASVERLDPREGRWTVVSPMAFARGAMAVSAAHGGLFALGGFDGGTVVEGSPTERGFLAVTERYDPRVGRWVAAAPMISRRAYGAAFCLEGRLYAMGGIAGRNSDIDIEIYDAAGDRWAKAQMPKPPSRSMGAAVVATWE